MSFDFPFVRLFGVRKFCYYPYSTIFHLYRGGQFYLWRKPEYPEKTTDLSRHWQAFHILLYRLHPPRAGFALTNLVVICTDCTGSCKSHYQTIMTTTAPFIQCHAFTVTIINLLGEQQTMYIIWITTFVYSSRIHSSFGTVLSKYNMVDSI